MQFGPSHSRRLRKQSRRLPVKGKGDDANRYFICWNCGFVCDAERDALGGPESISNISYGIYTEDSFLRERMEVYGFDDNRLALSRTAVLGKGHICLENDAAGNPRTIHENWSPDESNSGCPMCGTLNWRGDY